MMKVTVIGSSRNGDLEEFKKFSGHCAGICYMSSGFDGILAEDESKTMKRAEGTLKSGHLSVFDHNFINLYIEGIPKILAMYLNNEKFFVTSEKSARYTVMKDLREIEKKKYEKWCKKFEELIVKNGGEAGKKTKKLAMENARYMIGVDVPTCMAYTVSLRQLNYLWSWLGGLDLVGADELREELEKTGYVMEGFKDAKSRGFSLGMTGDVGIDVWSDIYSVGYWGSLAELAQAQRHRSIWYQMAWGKMDECYVPELLEGADVEEWKKDFRELRSEGIVPQGTLVWIRERGTVEAFVMKCKERICSCAQLEIMRQTEELLMRYYEGSEGWVKEELGKYANGKARCTWEGFECGSKCGWAEGINLQRRW